jgi:uncharacterized glyoxalase superfamily protein PhnB
VSAGAPSTGGAAVRLAVVQWFVDDVERALAWYETVFGMTRAFVHPSGGFGALATGTTSLAFATWDVARDTGVLTRRPGPVAAPAPVVVALIVEDAAAAYRRALDAGARGVAAPRRQPWGQVTGYVRDPHGLVLELGEPEEVILLQ